MPKRIRDTLVAVAVTGALAGGTAVVAQAATSGGSSTTPTPPAGQTQARPKPPAHKKGSGPCPNMGSGQKGAANPDSGSPGQAYPGI
jgi:hypothetical protein